MSNIQFLAKLSRKFVASGKKNKVYLMLQIIAQPVEETLSRLPLNLGFVLDRSGSMGGEKLAYTKQAVNYAINHFLPQDYASLTVFDGEVSLLVEAQPVVYKELFRSAVQKIFCGGCTNLSGGLLKGFREVQQNVTKERLNRVIILTDGLANEGITDSKMLCDKVKDMKENCVSVTTLGVGEDFDEDLLTTMAEASGGNYYFISSTDEIPRIFAQEMQSLLTVSAQNVRLTMKMAKNCRVSKVWGYEPVVNDHVTIELPDIFSSDQKILVMELEVLADETGPISLGSVVLDYEAVHQGLAHNECAIDLLVESTANSKLLDSPEEAEVMVQVELNRAAEVKEEAIRKADQGDVAGAVELLKNQADILTNSVEFACEVAKDEICLELVNINCAVKEMEEGSYTAMMRKKMSYESYQRRNNKK